MNLRWNVAKVKQAFVPQVDWFGVEEMRWYHSESDEVPGLPHLTKLLNSRNTEV
jgi:hypothetical protein